MGAGTSALPRTFSIDFMEFVSQQSLNGFERGLSPELSRQVKNKICHVLSLCQFVSPWLQTDTLRWSLQMLKYFGNLFWFPIDTTTACLGRHTLDWVTKDVGQSSRWEEVRALEPVWCSCWGVGKRSGTTYASLDSFRLQVLFIWVIFGNFSACHWALFFKCAFSWTLK